LNFILSIATEPSLADAHSALLKIKPVPWLTVMVSTSPVTGFLIGSSAIRKLSPSRALLSSPFIVTLNGTNCGSNNVLKVVAKISNGNPPALPEPISSKASRCSWDALSSTNKQTVPFPSWIAPGHFAANARPRPSSDKSPYLPRSIFQTPMPSQKPGVGGAANSHGQP